MSWILLALSSALFLGLYDSSKKRSLQQNNVFIVLFFSTLSGGFALVVLTTLSILFPHFFLHFEPGNLNSENLPWLAIKALIVTSSWICSFAAIKHLPLSISAPIRASAPFFTLLASLVIYSERPRLMQWVGILILLFSYWRFALAGKSEGLTFSRNPWIFLMILSAILGASSSLYDKYLLQYLSIDPLTVQIGFTGFMILFQGLILLLTILLGFNAPGTKFSQFYWHWSIPCVGFLLIIADQFYFRALAQSEALVSIVSLIRRSSVILSFLLGFLIFKEKNLSKKGVPLLGILAGLSFLILG